MSQLVTFWVLFAASSVILPVRVMGEPTLAGVWLSEAGEEREIEGQPVLPHLASVAHLSSI